MVPVSGICTKLLTLRVVIESFRRNLEVWKRTKRNLTRAILPYLTETMSTQNHAIVCSPFSPFLDWNAWGRVRPLVECVSSTPSTHGAEAVFPILSKFSIEDSPRRKCHTKSPPLTTWRKDRAGHLLYYIGDDWTGLEIQKITFLPAYCLLSTVKVLTLKPHSFRIRVSPFDPEGKRHRCTLVEAPTLAKAKKIAEWYYSEWSQVNQNLEELRRISDAKTTKIE